MLKRVEAVVTYRSLNRALALFTLISEAFLLNQHHLRPSLATFQPPQDVLESLKHWHHNAKHMLLTIHIKDEHIDEFRPQMTFFGMEKFIKLLDSGFLDYGSDCKGMYRAIWWKCDVFTGKSGTTPSQCVEGLNFMCSRVSYLPLSFGAFRTITDSLIFLTSRSADAFATAVEVSFVLSILVLFSSSFPSFLTHPTTKF